MSIKNTGWGSRSQIDQAMGQLRDLRSQGGNQDRLVGNEKLPAGTPGGPYAGNAILAKARAFLGPGLSTADEQKALDAFLAKKEAEWGRPVTDLDLSKLPAGKLFAAQKAIELERIGRTPAEVTEGFLLSAATLDRRVTKPGDEPLKSRKVFWQRFTPTASPSGKVVVVSPGFKETGANFYEQIAKMNALGHDVVVMDHQWAGLTDGKKGGLSRLFDAAKDVATVSAFAARLAKQNYGDGGEVVLFANSMGAAAAFAAATLNDQGLIKLRSPDLADGAKLLQMPKGLDMVLESPFFEATPNVFNRLTTFAAKTRILDPITKLPIPDLGLPGLSKSPVANQKINQGAIADGTAAQLETMASALPDLATVLDLVKQGHGPSGFVHIVQGKGDTLAHYEKSAWVAEQLGPRAEIRALDTKSHVLEQDPAFLQYGIDGLARVTSGAVEKDPLPAQSSVSRAAESWCSRLAGKVDKSVAQFFGQVGASPVGWLLEAPPPCTPATKEFTALLASAEAGTLALPAEAKGVKYLLVPGLFTERYPGYMSENLAALKGAASTRGCSRSTATRASPRTRRRSATRSSRPRRPALRSCSSATARVGWTRRRRCSSTRSFTVGSART